MSTSPAACRHRPSHSVDVESCRARRCFQPRGYVRWQNLWRVPFRTSRPRPHAARAVTAPRFVRHSPPASAPTGAARHVDTVGWCPVSRAFRRGGSERRIGHRPDVPLIDRSTVCAMSGVRAREKKQVTRNLNRADGRRIECQVTRSVWLLDVEGGALLAHEVAGVAARVLPQVVLMVSLRAVPGGGGLDGRRDRPLPLA
jgi:hypothetical protein